ncbi:MAG TPA: hypothetical protein VGR87_03980 [Candidatus Limnocylindria bacterium]|jgi:hypothetical protein|nr:hypothetical protein [Candidatus Limnocylindria bacterium]
MRLGNPPLVFARPRAVAIYEFAAADVVVPAFLLEAARGHPTLALP